MSDIRSKALRKAASLPVGDPQRGRLLDVLAGRRLTALGRGDRGENAGIRYERGMSTLRVWDLTNAGKRGKKVDHFALWDMDYAERHPDMDSLLEKFAAGLKRQTSYKRALAEAKMLVLQARDFDLNGPKIEESREMGVRVAPAGFRPLKIDGQHVRVESDYNSFVVRDKVDRNNLPTCIPRSKGSKKDVKQFFRWVTDNASKIKRMTFSEVLQGMNSEGIGYHQYCAMD